MRIIFFDTETTGNGPNDRLCQIGAKDRGNPTPVINELFKPPIPVAYEAMAVHHITEKMLAEKSLFKDAPEYAEMKALFEDPDTIAVAHNAAFDVNILAAEDITVANPVCTMKIARALDTEGVFSNYRLQYLRYRLGIEIEEDVVAHDAWGDVVVLEAFFERLLDKMLKTHENEAAAIEAMRDITDKPSFISAINFGKHAGKKMSDIAKEDPGYLEWLLKQKKAEPLGQEDWIYTLETALGRAV